MTYSLQVIRYYVKREIFMIISDESAGRIDECAMPWTPKRFIKPCLKSNLKRFFIKRFKVRVLAPLFPAKTCKVATTKMLYLTQCRK